MFPNYDNGRFSVMDDGTLVIESVQKDDAGEYICKGLSVAGSAYAKARLDVRGNLPLLFIICNGVTELKNILQTFTAKKKTLRFERNLTVCKILYERLILEF